MSKHIHIAHEGSAKGCEKWLRAIEEDGLVWTQILNDEERDECDLIRLYSVEGFPTKLLIGPDGEILLRTIGNNPTLDEMLENIFTETRNML